MYRTIALVLFFAASAAARDLYVVPDGSSAGDGTRDKPLDFQTALNDGRRVKAGDTVWLLGGTYRGPFTKSAQPAGSPQAPIIYRAMTGQRVTLTAPENERDVISLHASHTWLWGMEITIGGEQPKVRGGAVRFAAGDGVKVINLIVHDNPNRSGIDAWAVGDDQEIYGCLMYRNGIDPGAWAHGTYTQNIKKYNTKTFADCLIFNNFGWGVHGYSEEKAQANFLFEGCAVYGNGLPPGSAAPCVNLLLGGHKDADNITVDACYTYFPRQFGDNTNVDGAVASAIKHKGGSSGRFKRGADFGYIARNNGRLVIRNSVFVGGLNAVEIKCWHRLTFIDNLCYTHTGYGLMMTSPVGIDPVAAEPASYDPTHSTLDRNTYCADGTTSSRHIHRDGKGYDDLQAWQQATGWDQNSRFVQGTPTEPMVVLRPNKYEPDRAHLIVYNWPATKTVSVDFGKLWQAEMGRRLRVLNVEDYWGEPVAEFAYDGKAIDLSMAGSYAPDFACYIVMRQD